MRRHLLYYTYQKYWICKSFLIFTGVTADDIAKELSCLDLRFLVKIKSQNMIIPNRKCPLNIIQWQNMQNYIWHLSFSDIAENIKQNYFTSATGIKYYYCSKNTIIIYKTKKTYIQIYR